MAHNNRFLQLKNNTWWFVKRTPLLLLRRHPSYNAEIIWINTKCSDIKKARILRDIHLTNINIDLEATKRFGDAPEGRMAFLKSIFEQEQEILNKKTDTEFDIEGNQIDFIPSIEDYFDLEDLSTNNPELFTALQLFIEEKRSGKVHGLSLSDALKLYKKYNGELSIKTLKKHESAVKNFLNYTSDKNIPLESITKRYVQTQYYDYAVKIESADKINTTLQCLSRIAKCPSVADQIGDQYKNPFIGHKLIKRETLSYNNFENNDLKLIFRHIESIINPDQRIEDCILALEMIWTTGARREEICSLRNNDFKRINAKTLIFKISKGKTANAKRTLCVHSSLIEKVEIRLARIDQKNCDDYFFSTFSTEREDEKRGEYLGKWFTKIKNKVTPQLDRRYGIHSFRRHMATLMERKGIPESTAVWILGHERTASLSYGLYSDGPDIDTIQAAIELQHPMRSNFIQ